MPAEPFLRRQPLPSIRDRADARLGALIEAADRGKHRWRLARTGWERALNGRPGDWASGSFAPRPGNRLDVHVDGVDALRAICDAVAGARDHVHVAGWTVTPGFVMRRDPEIVTLRELLAEAATRARVRVLVWAGAPLGVFHPSRGETRAAMRELTAGTGIRGALDSRSRPMHCHHEKLVIVDGEVAFVGGIDLTDVAGDRLDSRHHDHRAALGWHDSASELHGPAVADVAAHFALRWQATTGEQLPPAAPPAAAGPSRVQVVRTVPEKTYDRLRGGDFSILEAYLRALRSAQRLVYAENQFLWSAEVVAVLCEKLREPPSDDFRMCLVLPRRPNNGNDDTRGQLGVLLESDRQHRLLVGTIGPPGRDHPDVYVHSKIAVVDDRWLTIGSANLNEHSLFNDTEVNVVSDDPELARRTRERLWTEHLAEECAGRDPVAVVEERWRPVLSGATVPPTPLRRLPSLSRRSSRLFGPLNGLVVDG